MERGRETDESLMADVATGDRDSLAPLVRRYASPLLTYIERMVGHRNRAEELLQEVFLRVWIKRRTYVRGRPFRPWLFAIATNHCRADFRKNRLDVRDLDAVDEPPALVDSPHDAAVATETAVVVARGIAQLPTQQRTVLVLRVWNGLSYADIADIVDRAEATVRSHMHHALAAMRSYLEPRIER